MSHIQPLTEVAAFIFSQLTAACFSPAAVFMDLVLTLNEVMSSDCLAFIEEVSLGRCLGFMTNGFPSKDKLGVFNALTAHSGLENSTRA